MPTFQEHNQDIKQDLCVLGY